MNRVIHRLVMALLMLGYFVSVAHTQNLDVLKEDAPVSSVASEPAAKQEDIIREVSEPPADAVMREDRVNPQPSQGTSTPMPIEEMNAQAPVSGTNPEVQMEEKTVNVDPLSDENLKDVLATTQGQSELTPDEASRYTLGPTDVITIQVMRHPEVSGNYEVNTEGKIQYEFVGDVVLSGLTKDEAAKSIAGRLQDYIVNPEVNVKIIGYNSKVVYVMGEVGKPGKIFMRGNTITIREALLEAGLPLLSGVTRKSSLITPSEEGKIEKKHVDVYALLYQGDLRENLTMNPGDVLYVPPTFLTKTMRAISPITQPVSATAGTAGSVYRAPGL
jgi:polysaccharide biosynthesis/export protein